MPRRKGKGEGKYRSRITGRYVSAHYGKRHPNTVTKEEQMYPNLTHYYGRKVESVEARDTGWVVVLEGGIQIVNADDNYEMPNETLVGQVLQMSTFEMGVTRAFFGTDDNPRSTVMFFNPTKYGIVDPNYEDGKLVYPQSTEEERYEAFEPSAPGERVVDEPSDEYLASQAQPDAEAPENVAERVADEDGGN